jgi:hypothetical protein
MKISAQEHPWDLRAGLLIIKDFIGRLASLFTINQRDLKDAGVYLRRTRS